VSSMMFHCLVLVFIGCYPKSAVKPDDGTYDPDKNHTDDYVPLDNWIHPNSPAGNPPALAEGGSRPELSLIVDISFDSFCTSISCRTYK